MENEKPAGSVKGYQFWRVAWWTGLFSAFKIWEYTPKEVGVWNLSSWVTIAQVTGLNALLSKVLPAFTWSSLFTSVKAASVKVFSVVAAAVVTVFEMVFN